MAIDNVVYVYAPSIVAHTSRSRTLPLHVVGSCSKARHILSRVYQSFFLKQSIMVLIRLILSSLILFVSSTGLVRGSPVFESTFQDSATFDEHFDIAPSGPGDPLRRVLHHHGSKRDLHHELFHPRNELLLDVLLGSYLSHNTLNC